MSLQDAFDQAVEAGAVEEDILKVEDLKIKIMPLGAAELAEFIPNYIEKVKKSDRPMNQKFVHNLMVEIVKKEISLGMCHKNNEKTRIKELESLVLMKSMNTLSSTDKVFEKDGCYRIIKVRDDEIKVINISNWVVEHKQIVIDQDGKQKSLIKINRNGYRSTAELTHTSMKSVSEFESILKERDQNIYISATPKDFNELFKPYFSSIPSETIYSEDYLGLHFSSSGEPIFLYTAENSESRINETCIFTYSLDPKDRKRICNTDAAKEVNYQLRDCDEEQFKFLITKMVTVFPKINIKEKVLTVLPWFLAALLSGYLKEEKGNNFPVLALEGNGEDGKSELAKFPSLLIGHNTGIGLTLSSTAKPIRLAFTGSNACPTILEEANTNDHKGINKLIDLLKSAYDNHKLSVGKIKGTDNYYLVNPVCLVTNYNITDPALMTRMIKLEMLKSDWENNPEAKQAYKEMEEISSQLNQASQRIIAFLFSHYKVWDKWYNRANDITYSIGSDVGRTAKSLNAIAFGLVILQELTKSLQIDITGILDDPAIIEQMKWLKEYLHHKKSDLSLEGEFLRFVARKHQPGLSDDHYLYNPTSKHPVAIDRMHWLDKYMEYLGNNSETKGIPRSAVERATRVKVAKSMIDTIRPRIGSRQPTFSIIDIDIAEKEFGIAKIDWEETSNQNGMQLTGLPGLPEEL